MTQAIRVSKRALLQVGVATAAAGALAGCGFRLRGDLPKLVFKRVAFSGTVGLVSEAVGKALALQGIERVDALMPTNAAGDSASGTGVLIRVSADQRERTVVGSTIAGQVRELNLRIQYSWQALDEGGRALTPPTDVSLEQDMSYQESATLSKQLEQDAVFEGLQARVVQQVMRRLAAIDLVARQP